MINFNLYPKQSACILSPANFILYGGSAASGKDIDLYTKILTDKGFVIMKDIKVGDHVFDKDGNICNVVAKSEVFVGTPAFKVIFDTGEEVITGADHEWLSLNEKERNNNFRRSPEWKAYRRSIRPSRATGKRPDLAERNAREAKEKFEAGLNLEPDFGFLRTTQEMYENKFRYRSGELTTVPEYSVSICKSLNTDLFSPINDDFYLIGLWLGDGNSSDGSICTGDQEIKDWIIEKYDCAYVGKQQKEKFNGEIGREYWIIRDRDIKATLIKYNLIDNKHIPEDFFFASEQNRRSLLAGLMDSDGYIEKNNAFMTMVREDLVKQIRRLACSLEIKCSKIRRKKSFYTTKEGERIYTKDNFTFYMYTKECPFRLKRKADKFNLVSQDLKLKNSYRLIKDIIPVENLGTQCIQVDSPSHTYLITEALIPTHNSYLIRAASIMYSIEIPNLTTYIFRRTFNEVMGNHWHGDTGFNNLLKPYEKVGLVSLNKSDHSIEFQNGSRIVLAHAQHEHSIETYNGLEIQLLIIDEATKFTPFMIEYLLGRVRLGSLNIPDKYKHKFPFVLAASNPLGPSHMWWKRNFVDYGDQIHRMDDDKFGMLAQFIQAFPSDNLIMVKNDPGYLKRLGSYSDQRLVRAMRDGVWEVEGSLAFPSWEDKIHLVQPFVIPKTWKIKRSFDYGYSAPYAAVYYAVSNGDSYISKDGDEINVPKKSIFIIDMIYGADDKNEGLRQQPREIGEVVRKQDELWESRGYKVIPGPADNSIFSKDRGDSIAKLMEDVGIKWETSNKKPGSRIQGLQLINQRLYEALKNPPEKPILKVFNNCTALISEIKNLQMSEKDLDDVDTNGLDHAYDALRYAILDANDQLEFVDISGY